jgi:hypothetical protein
LLYTLYSLATHFWINLSLKTPFKLMDFLFDYKPALQIENQTMSYPVVEIMEHHTSLYKHGNYVHAY